MHVEYCAYLLLEKKNNINLHVYMGFSALVLPSASASFSFVCPCRNMYGHHSVSFALPEEQKNI